MLTMDPVCCASSYKYACNIALIPLLLVSRFIHAPRCTKHGDDQDVVSWWIFAIKPSRSSVMIQASSQRLDVTSLVRESNATRVEQWQRCGRV